MFPVAPPAGRAAVLLWAHRDQASGNTDSAAALQEGLEDLGLEVVAVKNLPAQDLGSFEAVFAVLGTFPRMHAITSAEGEALAAYLTEARGALYLEGGDAWYDLPPELEGLLGASLADDGAGDLAVLEGLDGASGGSGPDLAGLVVPYGGENRSLDRLMPEGEGAVPLWRNRDTGAVHSVFLSSSGGYRVVGCTFEFGGLPGDRREVLRSYLLALGVLDGCAPAVEGLSGSADGRRITVRWSNSGPHDSIRLEEEGRSPRLLAGDSTTFQEFARPGEHRYRVIGISGECEAPAAFATVSVLSGAHLIWRPPETLPGPDDSAREVRAALEANGRGVVAVSDLSGLDLREVGGLWAILGSKPYHHVLSEEEGNLLASYLTGDAGPEPARLYLEGGEIWSNDRPAALRELAGVQLVAGAGVEELRHLRGLDTGVGLDLGALVRLPVDYTAETESLDIIAPDPEVAGAGPAWVDDDSGEVMGVFRADPGERFSILSVSFEFGGVTHTREERALLMELYLTVLEGIVPEPPIFKRGDVDGTGDVSLTDAIQILGRLFLAGSYDQDCEDAADSDDSGEVDLTDVIIILNYLFLAGKPPALPGPETCGPDPTEEDLLEECFPLPDACEIGP